MIKSFERSRPILRLFDYFVVCVFVSPLRCLSFAFFPLLTLSLVSVVRLPVCVPVMSCLFCLAVCMCVSTSSLSVSPSVPSPLIPPDDNDDDYDDNERLQVLISGANGRLRLYRLEPLAAGSAAISAAVSLVRKYGYGDRGRSVVTRVAKLKVRRDLE